MLSNIKISCLSSFSFLDIISIYLTNIFFVDINECASDPCQNDGFCQDGINQYTCLCLPGYSGLQCKMGKFILVTKYDIL